MGVCYWFGLCVGLLAFVDYLVFVLLISDRLFEIVLSYCGFSCGWVLVAYRLALDCLHLVLFALIGICDCGF